MTNMRVKKITKKHHLLLLLLFLATICMGVGYASVFGVLADIEGSATALPSGMVHITVASYSSNNGADLNNSSINDFFNTTLNSTITLGNNAASTITYAITITNETDYDYVFTGTSYDAPDFYDNSQITYDISNMNVGYRLNSNTSKTFNITFRYVGSNTSNPVLNSYISFDFGIVHDITYVNIANTSGYPSYVIDGDTLNVTFTNDVPYAFKITKSDNSVLPSSSYTYTVDPNNSNNKILSIPNVDDDLTIDRYYSIAYVLDGGTNNSNNPSEFLANAVLTISAPTYADHVFDGWYDNAGFSGNAITSTSQLNSDTTLYAKWIPIYYITYVLNGGTQASNQVTQFIPTVAQTILAATHPHDATFDNWYQNSGLTGTAITSTSQLSGDSTLYAKWISSINNTNFNTSNNRFESTNVSDLKLSNFRSYQYTQNTAHTTVTSVTLYVNYNSSNKSATLNCQVASTQSGFTTVTGTISIATSQSGATASTTFDLSSNPIQSGSNYTISCPSYSGDNNGKVKLNGVSFIINP